MKKSSVLLIILAVLLGSIASGAVSMLMRPENLYAQPQKFDHVVPLTFGTLLAFFDKRDGTVYIYDNKMEKVVIRVQLLELGAPLEKEIFETEPSGPQRPGMPPGPGGPQ